MLYPLNRNTRTRVRIQHRTDPGLAHHHRTNLPHRSLYATHREGAEIRRASYRSMPPKLHRCAADFMIPGHDPSSPTDACVSRRSFSLSLLARTIAGDGAELWSKRKGLSATALFIATTAKWVRKNRHGCQNLAPVVAGQPMSAPMVEEPVWVGPACHSWQRLHLCAVQADERGPRCSDSHTRTLTNTKVPQVITSMVELGRAGEVKKRPGGPN
jgi:hypothetical protein